MPANENRARLQGTQISLQPEDIGGLRVQITLDSSNQPIDGKYAALRRAIELVIPRVPAAFSGFPALPVYFGADVKCEACWDPEGPGGSLLLFLGNKMFETNKALPGQVALYGTRGPRGVADQIYDDMRKSKLNPARWWLGITSQYQASKASAKATAVVVHEIGHILHERRSQTLFWNNKRVGAELVTADIAQQVSGYIANNNLDEFVAEVFTGLVYEKSYSRDVLALYERHGGPRVH